MFVSKHACTSPCIYACACKHTCMHVSTDSTRIDAYLFACIGFTHHSHVRIRVYVYMCVRMYAYMHVCAIVFVYAYMSGCINRFVVNSLHRTLYLQPVLKH